MSIEFATPSSRDEGDSRASGDVAEDDGTRGVPPAAPLLGDAAAAAVADALPGAAETAKGAEGEDDDDDDDDDDGDVAVAAAAEVVRALVKP